MIFVERKTEKGYTYTCEDLFGVMEIESDIQLAGMRLPNEELVLDALMEVIRKQGLGGKTVTGTVKHAQGVVSYKLQRAHDWSEDTPCESTPTSTSEQESASPATRRFSVPGLSWCRKFAAAFREAWRKARE